MRLWLAPARALGLRYGGRGGNLRCVGIGLLGLVAATPAFCATYYVSATGNDANDGLAPNRAWRTPAKVGTFGWAPGFQPGDSVLFEGGKTFTGGFYLQADRSGGTASAPFTVGSYGTGRATLSVSNADAVQVWMPTTGNVRGGFVVKDLVLVGNGGAKSGNQPSIGVNFWNSNAAGVAYFRIQNVEVSGFGDGIAFGRDGSAGYFTDVRISNCVARDNPGLAGLSKPSGSGIILGGTNGGTVEYSRAFRNGAANTNSAGPVGIWTWDSRAVVIQFNESYDNRTGTNGGDGGGFDIDGGCFDCVIQYNYSHGNYGAGYLLAEYGHATPQSGSIVRYNVSENDGRNKSYGAIDFWGYSSTKKVSNALVYNNTVYVNTTGAVNGTPSAIRFLGSNVSNVRLYNNILVTANGAPAVTADTALGTSAAWFRGNSYHAASGGFSLKWGGTTYGTLSAWRATGQERSGGVDTGFQGDPLLAAPGTGGTVGDATRLSTLAAYKLQTASPLINRGLNLTAAAYGSLAVGVRDFWGNALPQNGAYEVGAHEAYAASTYAGWSAGVAWGTVPLAYRDPGDDPDFDGLVNLIEYAVGTDPTLSDLDSPLAPRVTLSASTISIRFRRARDGATYYVERSDTPDGAGPWTVIATNPGTVGTDALVSAPITANAPVFLRLRVVE